MTGPTIGVSRRCCSALRPRSSKEKHRFWRELAQCGRWEARKGRGYQERSEASGPIRSFILFKVKYPAPDGVEDGEAALVVYIKSTMTGDEPADLKQYQIDNPRFPHDPTTDQSFTEDQVESYRQLGYHIGEQLCEMLLRGSTLIPGKKSGESLWPEGDENSGQTQRDPQQRDERESRSRSGNAFSTNDIVNMLLTGYFEQPQTISISELERALRGLIEEQKRAAEQLVAHEKPVTGEPVLLSEPALNEEPVAEPAFEIDSKLVNELANCLLSCSPRLSLMTRSRDAAIICSMPWTTYWSNSATTGRK